MVAAGYHTANSILSALTILILLPLFGYTAFFKKESGYRANLLYAAMFMTASGAVSNLVYNYYILHSQYLPVFIFYFFSVLFYITLYFACFFFSMYLSCHAGYEDRIKKRLFILMIPVIAASLVVVFSFVFSFNNMMSMETENVCVSISVAVTYLCLALGFFMLWKIDRTLVVLPVMLFFIMLYFNFALYAITIQPFLLALSITYVHLSLTKRMILIHLGGIILTLCVLTTLIIGNMVTSSAFVSYLKTIHDRNDSHLTDVIVYMENYKALPWLMEYWMENADVIVRNTAEGLDNEFMDEYGVRLSEITSEEAARLPADSQLLFAEACYYRIADFFEREFSIHNLDDLFLIVPNDTDEALIIFDAEKNEDGTYRLGQYRDIEEEMIEWINYDTVVTDSTTWTWGQYSKEDDFGFYREIPFGMNGESAYLCNSFNRSEIYQHLDFISSSRTRAIRYLVLSAAIILLSLYFMLLRPLSAISNTAKRYQEDKDSSVVTSEMEKIHLRNEIGTFANEFSSLASEMDRYTSQVALLAGEKERVNTELRMAKDIQLSALPSVFPAFPDRKDFDIFADMNPAKEVGGDFYDFFLIDDNRLAFLIADVSDKGVPAALFMMSAKNLISYRVHEGGSPGEILAAVNSHLCVNNVSMMFVTVWLGILDISSGVLEFASAGHEPPAIKTGDGSFVLREEDDSCIVIGIMDHAEYKDQQIKLSPGDVIFIYTDGVTEARNISDDLYGQERLLTCLDKARDDSPADIIRRVKEDIDGFAKGAEQSDDVTMLAVKLRRENNVEGL